MANKRMFSLSVVDTDQFLEMPLSSRLLYYELGMRADDDGFVSNWKKILAFTGLKEDDMKVLIAKKYIIPFESGIIVIRHWRMNNYLQNDRTKPTIYKNEMQQLDLSDGVYELYTDCIHSIDKNSIDKNSIDNYSIKNNFHQNIQCDAITNNNARCLRESSFNINGINYCNQHARDLIPNLEIKEKFVPPTLDQIKEYCLNERHNNIDYQAFYDYFETGGWVDSKGNKVKNWKQKIITWEKNKNNQFNNQNIKQEHIPSWYDNQIKEIEYDEETKRLAREIEGS